MDGRIRSDIKIGAQVKVIQKNHQKSGELTEGNVAKILTNSAHHPHGIKVMLDDEIVGRVKVIIE